MKSLKKCKYEFTNIDRLMVGNHPLIVISDKLLRKSYMSISGVKREVTVKRNVNSTLIGCRFMVFMVWRRMSL